MTGRLPSVLPYLCNVDVVLVPLKFESGTRFKILEPGACAKSVVSTVLGAEGIPVNDEAVWHGRGSDGDGAEPWHHGGEIVSPVEAVFEFGEVAGHMLVADGSVSASDGALDVAEGGIDPLEGRVQGGLAARPGDDRLRIGME